MRETMTISLNSDLKKRVEAFAKREQIPKSDLVRFALEKYLAKKNIDKLREKMLAHAQKQGVYTDEDVFDAIS